MSKIIPPKKPQRGLAWLQDAIDEGRKSKNFHKGDRIVLVGVRGFYRDSMGVKGANDRRIFDDAFFWVDLETGFVASYNGNTDPNGVRKGKGTGSSKGMASLKPGVWRSKPGKHKGRKAFVQAVPFTVIRDGINGDYEDTGWFGINTHDASDTSTSSLGCQTTPGSQWVDFRETGYKLLDKAEQDEYPYILIERQG